MPGTRKRIRMNPTRGAVGAAKNTPANFRRRIITILLATLALALKPGLSGALVEEDSQCQMQIENDAFIPCGETFLVQPGPGMGLVPYTGQMLPSDGEVIDLFDEDHAFQSENGLLEVTFNLMSGTPDNPLLVGSKPYKVITYPHQGRLGGIVYSYNGIFPGPTLIANPGDTIRININDQRKPASELQTSPKQFDPTNPVAENSNLHTHGLLVSPTGQGDNIYRSFLPGNSYVTEFKIPRQHDQGANWYHPHFHTSTASQVYGGLAGFLQIGNILDTSERSAYVGLTQRNFLLMGMALAPSSENPGMYWLGTTANGTSQTFSDPNPAVPQGIPSDAPKYTPTQFVNGQLNPIIKMRPGETQVWTFLNASPFAAFSLGIYRIGSNSQIDPATPLFQSTLLVQDGNDKFTPFTTTFTRQRNILKDTYLAAGERLTWALTAPTEPGDYYLVNVRDYAYTSQISNLPEMLSFQPPASFVPSVILATVRVEGKPSTTPPPEIVYEYPPFELAIEPQIVRDIAFDFDEHNLRGRINFGYFPDLAMAQSFSGDIERWVVSTYSAVSHPFHIHQGQFVIEQIEYFEDLALTRPRTDLPNNPVINEFPRDMDTFAFPAKSKTTIKLQVSRFVGKFVMHCHLLLHEDSGMMVTVRVVPSRNHSLTVVGANAGEAPVVSLARSNTGNAIGSFQVYDDGYTGGVDSDVGHLLPGQEYKPFVVTVQKTGTPAVRVFDALQPGNALLELTPFDAANGASVALGDIDGDSVKEIIVGSGPGQTPTVTVYTVSARPNGSLQAEVLYSFPVLDDSYKSAGVRVAAADIDGDNWDDVIVANGPGAANRVMVFSGQELQRGSDNTLIVDAPGIIPGSQGLNIAADNMAGGFFRYPPLTEVGFNPPAPTPYRAIIAVTPAVAATDPAVRLFYYIGGGGHSSHGATGDPDNALLRPLVEFTPFPGKESQDGGLTLTTGLTLMGDKDNPLVGLISARALDQQQMTYFDIGGNLETRPWAGSGN